MAVPKVSKSLDQAIKRDRAKHPDRTGYTALRRGAFSFLGGLFKEDTKAYTYVTSEYAKDSGRYYNDLKDATCTAVKSLKALGASDSEIKRLL